MENMDFECTILDVDSQDFISKLISLGSKNKGEYFFRKYVYDFYPKNTKHIILKTDGKKTTLSVKETNKLNKQDDASILEVVVSDFEMTNQILNNLGYRHRRYQENVHRHYSLNDVSITINSWPLIPDYVEIKGSSESDVLYTLKLLGITKNEISFLDIETIYKDIYGIDISSISYLKFDDDLLESN